MESGRNGEKEQYYMLLIADSPVHRFSVSFCLY